jgi:hypothetical protein
VVCCSVATGSLTVLGGSVGAGLLWFGHSALLPYVVGLAGCGLVSTAFYGYTSLKAVVRLRSELAEGGIDVKDVRLIWWRQLQQRLDTAATAAAADTDATSDAATLLCVAARDVTLFHDVEHFLLRSVPAHELLTHAALSKTPASS